MNERIRFLRTTLGFTLEEFAERIGMSHGGVSDIEGDFSGLVESVDTNDEFEITGYSLSFSGVCLSCKQEVHAP